jgi:predicted neuraminidase
MVQAFLVIAMALSVSQSAERTVVVPEGEPVFEERMVCPENSPFPFSHGSTIVEFSDGTLFCAWYAGSREKGDDVAIVSAELPKGAQQWAAPRVLADTPGKSEGNPVLYSDDAGVLWLFYQTIYGSGEGPTEQGTGWTSCKVKAVTSADRGATWSEERVLIDELGYVTRNKVAVLSNGAILLPLHDERNWSSRIFISSDKGNTWEMSEPIDCGLGFHKGNIEPALLERKDGSVLCLMRTGSERFRTWESISTDDGRHWSKPVEIEVPNPNAALDLLRLDTGNVLMALNPVPEGNRERLSVWLSADDGHTWMAFRDVENGPGHASYPALIQGRDGRIHMTYSRPNGGIKHVAFNEAWVWDEALVKRDYFLANVVPPLGDEDDPRASFRREPGSLPLRVAPFEEHVGKRVPGTEGKAFQAVVWKDTLEAVCGDKTLRQESEGVWIEVPDTAAHGVAPRLWAALDVGQRRKLQGLLNTALGTNRGGGPLPESRNGGLLFNWYGAPYLVTGFGEAGEFVWVGTTLGLGFQEDPLSPVYLHPEHGVKGPLSTNITAVAVDADAVLWIGTPLGISLRDKDGNWSHLRGKDGLPYEDVTDIEIASNGDVWIGTTRGAILYRPVAEGRKWFYRAGARYLPDDHVNDVAVTPDGKTAYFATNNGIGRVDLVTTTLLEKAQVIEKRVNERHRRLGLVSECMLDNAESPTSHVIGDNDNDGLWTAYHVAAMSMCYAVTGDEEALRSAKESMHAVIMLQNASGTPGLVARSVVPAEEGKTKGPQWRPTPDGTMYWKSDTSSDEIDGHYFAFYTYWEHIARFIPEERALIIKQVRDLTDYLVDNGYLLIDWDGEHTRWGFWSPELVNDLPEHYLESGLNSLQMLSFLKVAHYITGDPKYKDHYDRLICDHGYLNNVLLEKKVFPDENNHSDNQLGYVAWYPILQLEWDPKVRRALHQAVRRHYRTLADDRSSFFNFVTATIDPDYVDLEGAIANLREIPADRRRWRMENSHRADVIFDPRIDRFGDRQLLYVLPADERDFGKWNGNVYLPDGGGDGREEDDGAAYLLPYWMGRYHRFFTEQTGP